MQSLRASAAFLKRDWQLMRTYRFSFWMDIFHTLAALLIFFFIGRVFLPGSHHAVIRQYGADYFQFVLIGIVFSGFMSVPLSSLTTAISFERGAGTLEAILMTPTSITVLAGVKVLWDFGLLILKTLVFLALGSFVLQLDFPRAHWGGAFLTVALTTTAFFGLGLLCAGASLLLRETGPLELVIGGVSRFLGGVYFPLMVLPEWARSLSTWIPLSHTLEALRKSLLLGGAIPTIQKELGILLGCTAVFIPTGILFFRWALNKARYQGSLGLE